MKILKYCKSTTIFQTAAFKARFDVDFLRSAVSSAMELREEMPITTLSVKDLIWGYDVPLIRLAKSNLPPHMWFPFDKFGFFYEVN